MRRSAAGSSWVAACASRGSWRRRVFFRWSTTWRNWRKIIDARVAGEEYVAAEVEEPPTNVVDLMAALRRSLDAASASKKKPAKAELPAKKTTVKAEPKRRRA